MSSTFPHWLLATLLPDLVMTVDVGADVPAGDVTNTATVSSPTTDPREANNTDTNDLPIIESADVSLTKSHDGPVRIGDALDFELIASNAGLSVARDVVVTDPVPDALTVSGAAGTGWTCDVVVQLVTCTLEAPLAPNTSADPITISTLVTAADYPSVTNVAQVSTSAHDPNPANNTAIDRVLVPPLVDLAISKTHTGVLQVGSDATYTLSVVNLGPTNDPNPVRVVDTLPTGLTYVSATGEGWTCGVSGQTVLCRLPAGMGVGAAAPITLVVHVGSAAYPSVTNTASVSSASEDTDPTNNSASDPAEVLPLVRARADEDPRILHRRHRHLPARGDQPRPPVQCVSDRGHRRSARRTHLCVGKRAWMVVRGRRLARDVHLPGGTCGQRVGVVHPRCHRHGCSRRDDCQYGNCVGRRQSAGRRGAWRDG